MHLFTNYVTVQKWSSNSKVKESCSNPETPSRVAIVGPRRLSEFLIDQNQSPKIPPPIYLAIHQVDQKLTEEGIYRIPGAAKTLQEIKKKVFFKKLIPNELLNSSFKLLFGEVNNVKWEDIDVHTLTTFIKVKPIYIKRYRTEWRLKANWSPVVNSFICPVSINQSNLLYKFLISGFLSCSNIGTRSDLSASSSIYRKCRK